jgi:hypothetical protein
VQRNVDVAEKFEVLNFMSWRGLQHLFHSPNHRCVVLVFSKQANFISLILYRNLRNVTLDQSSASRPEMRSCLSSTTAIIDTIG